MRHEPASYVNFRRVLRRKARAATQVISARWFSGDLETDSIDEVLVELCCLELQRKNDYENAVYERAYESMPSRTVPLPL